MTDDDDPGKPIDPQACLRRMWIGASDLAQAKANRVHCEEYRKTLKALLMRRSGAKSAVEQERDAYAHPEYAAHLEGLKAAVEAEEMRRWRMVTDQLAVEVWRSLESSARGMDRGTR